MNNPVDPYNLNNSFFSDLLIDRLNQIATESNLSSKSKHKIKDLKLLAEKIGTFKIDEPELLKEIFALV